MSNTAAMVGIAALIATGALLVVICALPWALHYAKRNEPRAAPKSLRPDEPGGCAGWACLFLLLACGMFGCMLR